MDFSKPQQGVHAKDLLSGWEVDADRFLDSHKKVLQDLFNSSAESWRSALFVTI